MAMAAVGPRPGSTPTRVPSSEPNRAIVRLTGERAAPNPAAKWLRTSTVPQIPIQPVGSGSCNHTLNSRKSAPVVQQPMRRATGHR